MFLFVKTRWKLFSLSKCIENDSYNKNTVKIILTLKMHWKGFLYKNALQKIFLCKNI